MANLESPVNLSACLWTVAGSQVPGESEELLIKQAGTRVGRMPHLVLTLEIMPVKISENIYFQKNKVHRKQEEMMGINRATAKERTKMKTEHETGGMKVR